MSKTLPFHTVDIEASGLDAAGYPIEVGILLADGGSYSALIKPVDGWEYWDDGAEGVHGLSREYLMEWGQDLRDVCLEINEFCHGKTLYSDAWIHDSRWLRMLFEKARIGMHFCCSPIELLLTESMLINWSKYKKVVSEFLDIAPHRALNDAIIVQSVLENLAEFKLRGCDVLPAALIDCSFNENGFPPLVSSA